VTEQASGSLQGVQLEVLAGDADAA